MFNFLVTASGGAWDLPGYEYRTDRLCIRLTSIG